MGKGLASLPAIAQPAAGGKVKKDKDQPSKGQDQGKLKQAATIPVKDAGKVKKDAPGSKKAAAKGGSEIDDIFNLGKKAAKDEPVADDPDMPEDMKEVADRIRAAREAKKKQAGGQAPAEPPAKKAKLQGNKDDIFGSDEGQKRKRTEEGYVIYSEEELGLGKKGGDTELCPFDCDCCF